MLIQFQEYLTLENVYLWTNYGVLPFWLMMILIPSYKITKILINSIILPLILSAVFINFFYQALLLNENFLEFFNLYNSLDDLYAFFSSENLLFIIWIHFVALNLFLGSWITFDAEKHGTPKKVTFIPLLLVYFAGPVGLVFYWFIRIFYSKKLGLHL